MLTHFLSLPAQILTGGLIGGLGTPELLVILAVVLIIFGPKQLPKIGRAIGSGIRELKEAASRMTEDEDEPRKSSQPGQPEGTVASNQASEPPKANGSSPASSASEDASSRVSSGSHVS